MAEDSHVNFITDDSDFTYDSNIHVFTLWNSEIKLYKERPR
jgi:hypothetical protein